MSEITQNTNQIASNPFSKVIAKVCEPLFARETETTAMLTCVLAGYNGAFIGSVGTAKSMLARRIAEALPSPTFSCLLNPFSEPDDLLGNFSLSELKNDRRVRQTAGYLPTCRIAVLDEIFKARSTTLTSLLTILNERVFFEEGQAIPVLLQSVIGCSNEFPDDESGALPDRFVMFIPVDYVKNRRAFLDFALRNTSNHAQSLIQTDENGDEIRMITPRFMRETTAKIDQVLKDNVDRITDILLRFDEILQMKAGAFKDIRLSDRSLIHCARILATSCVMRQGSNVSLEDAWSFGFLAKTFEQQEIYQEACRELLKPTECLDALKERLAKGTRSDLLVVENAMTNLPIHWQMELKGLLSKVLKNNVK